MLGRYLIIAACAFVVGFGVATYWKSLDHALSVAERDISDAKQTIAVHKESAKMAVAIGVIEKTTLEGINHANDQSDAIRRDVAGGTVSLQLAGACPPVPAVASGAVLADGTRTRPAAASGQHRKARTVTDRPTLNPSVHPDYFALREGIARCRSKVTGLQAILTEERRVRDTK